LHWGCGSHTAPGWTNSDIKEGPDIDVSCDILNGLPFEDASFEYAVSIHALPELSYPELVPALEELRRVLKPGGALRLELPDLRKGIAAYERGDERYFQVPEEEARSLGARFIVHMLWYGYTRTLFTPDFAEELLTRAGFERARECGFRETATPFPGIVELDNREEESFFMEAVKGLDDTDPPPRSSRPPSSRLLRVLHVSLAHRDLSRLLGGHLDRPKPGEQRDGAELDIVGWAIGREAPAVGVVVESGAQVVGECPVNAERPDIAQAFGEEHGVAGFRLKLRAAGIGASDLDISVVLADGTRAPLGTIEVELTRRPPFARP
jgi:predicted SAM-dependent methyltransferase